MAERLTRTKRRITLKGALAIIERDGKILMQRRSEHIADPGTWVLPGGEVVHPESSQETIIRVCGEELGITVRPHTEIGSLTIAGNTFPVWRVLWKGKEVKLSGDAVTGIGWFTIDELLELEPVRYQDELRSFLKSGDIPTALLHSDRITDDLPHENHSTPIDESKILSLVERAQSGDHEAFGEIYDIYIMPIYRYVAFRLPTAVAEDIVADIFVKAWEKLGSYRYRASTPFSSWLFRIARNIVIDTYRTRKETSELDELHIDEDRWNDPKLKMTQDLQSELIRKAMNQLPRRYREVLLLTFMSDLSHFEAARVMRIREGGVRILKHRALKKLAELLPASMRDELP